MTEMLGYEKRWPLRPQKAPTPELESLPAKGAALSFAEELRNENHRVPDTFQLGEKKETERNNVQRRYATRSKSRQRSADVNRDDPSRLFCGNRDKP